MNQAGAASRPERRRKDRVRINTVTLGRFGATGVLVFDISDSGARIEHFAPLPRGKRARFRLDWGTLVIEVEAEVVACRVHRFASGREGGTVYQSGLRFTDYVADARARLTHLIESLVARSLAEQVANAKGLGPVLEKDMPVFRSGVVDHEAQSSDDLQRRISTSPLAIDRGYIRCTLIQGRSWQKKWTANPDQPEDGFTVSAAESRDAIDRLCEVYYRGSSDDRKLIRILAQMSVEEEGPVGG